MTKREIFDELSGKNETRLDQLSGLDDRFLVDIANGKVDVKAIAEVMLASRGLGLSGEWVGFDKAQKIHNI